LIVTVGAGRASRGSAVPIDGDGKRSVPEGLGATKVGATKEGQWQAGLRRATAALRTPAWRDALLLLSILCVAALLRFYRLSETTLWVGDQARDATIVMNALAAHQLPALGPAASIGTFSRGPAFFILLMPWFWLSHGDPAAGAAFVAAVDVGTAFILFLVARRCAGSLAGLVAASIWAVSPLAVTWARFMWEPQLVPFFTLLVFYGLARMADDGRWLVLVAVAFSLAWQCHDQALLLVPVLAIGVALRWRQIRPWHLLVAGAAGLASLTTYINYERHAGWADIIGMLNFVLHGTAAGGAQNQLSWSDRLGAALHGAASVLPSLGAIQPLLLVLTGAGIIGVGAQLRSRWGSSTLAIGVWLLAPLMFVFWRGTFNWHYLMVLMPLPVLLVGIGAGVVGRIGRVPAGVVSGVLIVGIGAAGLGQWAVVKDLRLNGGSLATTRAVVDYVRQQANGDPFAFRLVSYAEGTDSYSVPYGYLFDRGGQMPSARVDLPTFVAFDPPDPAFAADAFINGVAVVRFRAPDVGPNLLDGRLDTTGGWELPDGAATGGGDTPFLVIAGTRTDPLPPDGRNVARTIPVAPSRRFMLSLQFREAPDDGSQAIIGQVWNSVGPLPSGTRYVLPASSDWTTGSFFVDVPSDGGSVRIYLRNSGRQDMKLRAVELRMVMTPFTPGQPVAGHLVVSARTQTTAGFGASRGAANL
jgi:4-amino-4-deoxy-L-arabinose transferase-like glycosyltransferase